MRWEETAIGDGTLGVLGPGEQGRLDSLADLFDVLDVSRASRDEQLTAAAEWLESNVPNDSLRASLRNRGYADLLAAQSA